MAAEPYRSIPAAGTESPHPSGPSLGLDHVQVGAPPGALRFYTADPWGKRIELLA